MGCIFSRQTKEDRPRPTPSEVPNLEEALEKLARDEEKVSAYYSKQINTAAWIGWLGFLNSSLKKHCLLHAAIQ